MRTYCTLFDKNYLAKGLAMYESLYRVSSEPFRLFIMFMDDESREVFERLKPAQCYGVERRSVDGFQGLSHLKLSRSWQEYCWTCASQLCEFLFVHQGFEEVTYLDADLWFFSDPKPVHEEVGSRSIGIIEHRLIPGKQHLIVNGRFNVGWVSFKNTFKGSHCVSRWASMVRDRCDASTCGDQKYLDDWPEFYGEDLCIIQNVGANVAPWNVANYRLVKKDDLFLTDAGCRTEAKVVFYHFHEYQHGVQLTNYEMRPEDLELIYKPYIAAIDRAQHKIESLHLQAH